MTKAAGGYSLKQKYTGAEKLSSFLQQWTDVHTSVKPFYKTSRGGQPIYWSTSVKTLPQNFQRRTAYLLVYISKTLPQNFQRRTAYLLVYISKTLPQNFQRRTAYLLVYVSKTLPQNFQRRIAYLLVYVSKTLQQNFQRRTAYSLVYVSSAWTSSARTLRWRGGHVTNVPGCV